MINAIPNAFMNREIAKSRKRLKVYFFIACVLNVDMFGITYKSRYVLMFDKYLLYAMHMQSSSYLWEMFHEIITVFSQKRNKIFIFV